MKKLVSGIEKKRRKQETSFKNRLNLLEALARAANNAEDSFNVPASDAHDALDLTSDSKINIPKHKESGTRLLLNKISPTPKSQIQSNAFIYLSELFYPSKGKKRIEVDA